MTFIVPDLWCSTYPRCSKAKPLFESNDGLLTFLGDYGYEAARSSVLEEDGRYIEAAEACLNDKQLEEAVRLFLQHTHDDTGLLRAYHCVLDELWGTLSLGVEPKAGVCSTLLGMIQRASPEQVHLDQVSTIVIIVRKC